MIQTVRCDVPLNEGQVRFLQALCCGLRPAPAAVAAGYTISNGHHLLRHPAVRAAILEVYANLGRTVAAINGTTSP